MTRATASQAALSYLSAARADGDERLVTLREGELFAGPDADVVAYVETGALQLDMVMANGSSLCLGRVEPGGAVVDLDAFVTPAFTPRFEAVQPTRIACMRAGGGEAERMVGDARGALLATCLRLVHELACLQAPHRLYAELLRMAAASADGLTLALPSHGQLARRLCTTRETVSRELSFLRRTGVLGDGKSPRLLDRAFLLNSLARALGVRGEAEAWRCIGVRPPSG